MIKWWQFKKRRHCPHIRVISINGDRVNFIGGWRLRCVDCWTYLDGPPSLANERLLAKKLGEYDL